MKIPQTIPRSYASRVQQLSAANGPVQAAFDAAMRTIEAVYGTDAASFYDDRGNSVDPRDMASLALLIPPGADRDEKLLRLCEAFRSGKPAEKKPWLDMLYDYLDDLDYDALKPEVPKDAEKIMVSVFLSRTLRVMREENPDHYTGRYPAGPERNRALARDNVFHSIQALTRAEVFSEPETSPRPERAEENVDPGVRLPPDYLYAAGQCHLIRLHEADNACRGIDAPVRMKVTVPGALSVFNNMTPAAMELALAGDHPDPSFITRLSSLQARLFPLVPEQEAHDLGLRQSELLFINGVSLREHAAKTYPSLQGKAARDAEALALAMALTSGVDRIDAVDGELGPDGQYRLVSHAYQLDLTEVQPHLEEEYGSLRRAFNFGATRLKTRDEKQAALFAGPDPAIDERMRRNVETLTEIGNNNLAIRQAAARGGVPEATALGETHTRLDVFAGALDANRRTRAGKALSNSPEYEDILQCLQVVNGLTRNEAVIAEESVRRMYAANEALDRACQKYRDAKSGFRWTSAGRERLAMVTELQKLCRQEAPAIDALRDMDTLSARQKDRATWAAVMRDARTETVDVSAVRNATVGNAMSARLDLRGIGRDGFFTRQTRTPDGSDEQIIKNGMNRLPNELRQILTNEIKMDTEQILTLYNDLWATKPRDINDPDTYRDFTRISPILLGDTREASSPLAANPVYAKAFAAFVEDTGKRLQSMYIATGAGIRSGSDLSGRNVATSRMAALLGLSDSIANSRAMKVTNGGIESTGVFMNTAKGFDLQVETHQEHFAHITEFDTPEFQRYASSLEVFDLICGQCDRHANNLLYQTEPNANGGFRLVGGQGIDNDLSFGEGFTDPNTKIQSRFFTGKYTKLKKLTLIDKGLAERIGALTKDQLEYALGDLLSPEEVDAAWSRTQRIQERLPDMRKLTPVEWDASTAKEMRDQNGYFGNMVSACRANQRIYMLQNPDFQPIQPSAERISYKNMIAQQSSHEAPPPTHGTGPLLSGSEPKRNATVPSIGHQRKANPTPSMESGGGKTK